MTPAGMEKIKEAKKDGSWTKLDAIEELIMPEPLVKAFARNKKALKNFEAFPPSARKHIYNWIIAAKRPETLAGRIKDAVSKAARNERANEWIKPVTGDR